MQTWNQFVNGNLDVPVVFNFQDLGNNNVAIFYPNPPGPPAGPADIVSGVPRIN